AVPPFAKFAVVFFFEFSKHRRIIGRLDPAFLFSGFRVGVELGSVVPIGLESRHAGTSGNIPADDAGLRIFLVVSPDSSEALDAGRVADFEGPENTIEIVAAP